MASDALAEICAAYLRNCASTTTQNHCYASCSCEYCTESRNNWAAVINAGAVSELVKLLANTKNPMVVKNCLYCLFHITIDIEKRDIVLQQGIIPLLVERAENCLKLNERKSSESQTGPQTLNDKITNHIVCLYNNLCGSENDIPIELSTVKDFIPLLARILSEFQETHSLGAACRAIVNLAYKNINGGLAAVESGICTRLVELILHPDPSVAKDALDATANIATGNMVCKKEVLKCGVLPNLVQLLNSSPDENVKQNVYMIIANLCGGAGDDTSAPDRIQQIIDSGLFPGLVQTAKEGAVEVMRLACRALNNVACNEGGSVEQVQYLIEQGALEALYYQIPHSPDEEVLVFKLDALERILDRVEYKKLIEKIFYVWYSMF